MRAPLVPLHRSATPGEHARSRAAQAAECVRAGSSLGEASARYEVSVTMIRMACKAAGVVIRRGRKRVDLPTPPGAPKAALSDAEVEALVQQVFARQRRPKRRWFYRRRLGR